MCASKQTNKSLRELRLDTTITVIETLNHREGVGWYRVCRLNVHSVDKLTSTFSLLIQKRSDLRLNLILNPNASVFALLSSPNGPPGALWSLSAHVAVFLLCVKAH